MAALIPLHFETADVRMVMIDGVPWWVGVDIVAALGIVKTHQALTALEDYERGTYIVGTPSGGQEMIVINESGFYSLLFRSRKPVAAQFKRWLTCEVLPSIRQHGSYPPPVPATHSLPPMDDQSPWDGVEKTVGQRFGEERERWEAETGYKLAGTIPGFSKYVARAIEDNMGGIRKGNRMEMLLYAGIDVLYVMTGRRTLTAAERTVRDSYRRANPLQQASLLSAAIAIPTESEAN